MLTLKEAVAILSDVAYVKAFSVDERLREACKVGIDAINRIEAFRSGIAFNPDALLPHEKTHIKTKSNKMREG